jgi:hypothetical protein
MESSDYRQILAVLKNQALVAKIRFWQRNRRTPRVQTKVTSFRGAIDRTRNGHVALIV